MSFNVRGEEVDEYLTQDEDSFQRFTLAGGEVVISDVESLGFVLSWVYAAFLHL